MKQLDRLNFNKLYYLLGRAFTQAKYVRKNEEFAARIKEITNELDNALGYNDKGGEE